MLTMSTIVPELQDCLCIAQEHDTTLGKYWLLARSTHTNYTIVHNFVGEFLTFKRQLYVPNNLVPTILYEYQDVCEHFS